MFIKTWGVFHKLKKKKIAYCQQQKREKSKFYSVYDRVKPPQTKVILTVILDVFHPEHFATTKLADFYTLRDYPSSVSNAEFMGMSGVVPDR